MPTPFAISVTIKAIDDVTKTINKITSNVSRQGGAVNDFNRKMHQMSGVRRLSSAITDFRDETNGVFHSLQTKRFFSEIGESVGKTSEAFKHLGSAAKQSLSMLTITGLAIGGLSIASSKMFSNLSTSNIDLKNSAAGLNISPSKLRSYRFAAESMGVNQSNIDSAFQRLNQMGFEMRSNNPGAAAPLLALKTSPLDKNMRQRAPDELLVEISDKLYAKGISDATRVQMSSLIFGSSDILPFLKLKSQGIKAETQHYQKDSFYEDSDRATDKYLKANIQFKSSLDQLARMASIELLPGFAEGLDRISRWIEANGGKLRSLFTDFGASIPKEMTRAVWFINIFTHALSFLSKHFGLANIAFTIFSVNIATYVGRAILSVVGAFNTLRTSMLAVQGIRIFTGLLAAFPTVAMFGGFMLVIGVITAVTYAIVKYRKTIAGWVGDVFQFFKEIPNYIMSFIKMIDNAVASFFKFASAFMELPTVNIAANKSVASDNLNPILFDNQSRKTGLLEQILESTNKSSRPQKDQKQSAEVTVKFENLPKGSRVSEPVGNATVNLFAGYQLAGGSS